MRNGIHFKNSTPVGTLVLVDNSEAEDGNSSDYFHAQHLQGLEVQSGTASSESIPPQTALVVSVSVSLACAVAAIATGSYAVWLSRQRSARQALTDVKDILKSCQERMQQLEADVQRLPRF